MRQELFIEKVKVVELTFEDEDELEEQRIMERMEDPEGGILLN